MTQVHTSYCDRLSTWVTNSENMGWLLKVAGVAIFAIGIGMATTAIAIDKGNTLQLNEYQAEFSHINQLSVPMGFFTLAGAIILGGRAAAGGNEMVDSAQKKLRSPPYFKNVQLTIVIIGIAVALFGIGMAAGATAIHNSSAFSDPDNLRFYDSQAALDAVGTHLTTLTALGFTLIPMIGGGIAAAGFLSSIPLKIAKWLEGRADVKRKADEAKKTRTINLNGEHDG